MTLLICFPILLWLQTPEDSIVNTGPIMFTLVRDATPRAMTAVESWTKLSPAPERIIVYAADQFSCDQFETIETVVCFLDHSCAHPVHFRTQINCIWKHAHVYQGCGKQPTIYINADIVLMNSHISEAIEVASAKFGVGGYLIVGRRIDYQEDTPTMGHDLNFEDPHWSAKLTARANEIGVLHEEYGLDYWVHSPSSFAHCSADGQVGIPFPDFLAGVYRWDNHLLTTFFLDKDTTVIDATAAVTAVHLDDAEYIHDHKLRFGAEYNDKLTRVGLGRSYMQGHVFNAGYVLKSDFTLQFNRDRDFDAVELVKNIRHGTLTILLTYPAVIDSTLNYLKWVSAIEMDGIVVVALDISSAKRVHDEFPDASIRLSSQLPSKGIGPESVKYLAHVLLRAAKLELPVMVLRGDTQTPGAPVPDIKFGYGDGVLVLCGDKQGRFGIVKRWIAKLKRSGYKVDPWNSILDTLPLKDMEVLHSPSMVEKYSDSKVASPMSVLPNSPRTNYFLMNSTLPLNIFDATRPAAPIAYHESKAEMTLVVAASYSLTTSRYWSVWAESALRAYPQAIAVSGLRGAGLDSFYGSQSLEHEDFVLIMRGPEFSKFLSGYKALPEEASFKEELERFIVDSGGYVLYTGHGFRRALFRDSDSSDMLLDSITTFELVDSQENPPIYNQHGHLVLYPRTLLYKSSSG